MCVRKERRQFEAAAQGGGAAWANGGEEQGEGALQRVTSQKKSFTWMCSLRERATS